MNKLILILLIGIALILSGCTQTAPECDGHSLGERWDADDGCNTCQCTEQGTACTAMGCIENECITASDCTKPGVTNAGPCPGQFDCIQGQCSWQCNSTIGNPASVKCVEDGGEFKIITESNGSQYGICIFDDNSYCDEWKYFRGECSKGETQTECEGHSLGEKWNASDGCNSCECTGLGTQCTAMGCENNDFSCEIIEDCDTNLPHDLCAGSWDCIEQECTWLCWED
ncbi:MAG: DUF333 domain-containing protein [Candidatus Diapherotrites archaeon]